MKEPLPSKKSFDESHDEDLEIIEPEDAV